MGADHSAQASKRFQGELIVVAFWSARQWLLMGTSGWSHRSWRGPFFPMRLPVKRHLEYYATQFEIVELNGVFYRTPSAESVARWGDETGRHFVFAWKASKFISHWKRLTENSTNSLQLLEHWLSILAKRSGQFSFSCRRTSLRTQVGLAASRSRTRSGPMQKSGWENCTRTPKQTVWKTRRQRSRSLMSAGRRQCCPQREVHYAIILSYDLSLSVGNVNAPTGKTSR